MSIISPTHSEQEIQDTLETLLQILSKDFGVAPGLDTYVAIQEKVSDIIQEKVSDYVLQRFRDWPVQDLAKTLMLLGKKIEETPEHSANGNLHGKRGPASTGTSKDKEKKTGKPGSGQTPH